MRSVEEQAAALGTVLGVWAHPDDEAYLSGGLMALARDAGARVVCVTATRGEQGTGDPATWPPERLAAERTQELARSLAVLGVHEHHWLDLPDGGCADADADDVVRRLRDVMDDVRPDTVVTFGPDGITGHADHRAVSAFTTAAFRQAAPRGSRLLHAAVPEEFARRWAGLEAELGVYEPGYPLTVPADRLALHLVLDGATAERKVRALQEQRTQTEGLVAHLGLDTYTQWASEEAFVEPGHLP